MKEKLAVQEAFNELSPRYEEAVDAELNLFWGWSYPNFLEELLKQTEFKKDQSILDVATGTLVIPRKIRQLDIEGIRVTGLDLTEAMLKHGKTKISPEDLSTPLDLTCGDAMALPFVDKSFDIVVSGLASHHMNIPLMLSEMTRVLKPGGTLSLIDVGSSPFWEFPFTKFLARIFSFLYFFIKENPHRAWAEANALTNLRTPEGWKEELSDLHYQNITIRSLPSRFQFLPQPVSIICYKNT